MLLPLLLCIAGVLCIASPLALGAQYSDLEFLGVTCPGRDNCTTMSHNATYDFRFRNCECDSNCATFGDCCVDAPNANLSTRYYNPILECRNFGTDPLIGAYMVVGCPAGADRDLRQKCEGKPDMGDPFMNIVPVTASNGPTYPNAFCAACNGAALDRLIRWELVVACDELAPYNVSSAFIWQNLKRADDGAWIVEYESSEFECQFLFDRPADARRVRLCRPDLVVECPPNYQRRGNIRELCESYTAVVHGLVGGVRKAYRNPHCALCNNPKHMRGLVCDADQLITGRRKEFSFAHIFDVSGEGDVGSLPSSCNKNQKFDPATKTCRNLVCGIPGYVRRGKGCSKL